MRAWVEGKEKRISIQGIPLDVCRRICTQSEHLTWRERLRLFFRSRGKR